MIFFMQPQRKKANSVRSRKGQGSTLHNKTLTEILTGSSQM
jgi:hypothetical protein